MSTYNGWLPRSLGALGPQGATGPTGCGAVGANGSAGPYTLSSATLPTSALSFNSNDTEVLRISRDGGVEWKGKPSKAAEVLEQVLGNMIDAKAASASMRQRTYIRACKSLLSKARDMSKEQLVSYLEDSISNRESKAVLLALRELAETDGSE